MNEKTIIVTGKVRLAYCNIWQPRVNKDDEDGNKKPKYSAMILIPKDDMETQLAIKEAVEAAYQEGITGDCILKGNASKPPTLGAIHTPLRDGDEEHPGEEPFAGHMFLNATKSKRPDIFDINKDDIEDEEEVYSGCYARVRINFYPYNTKGGKGIAVSLWAIQKVADGEPLSKTSKNKDFF